MMTHEKYRGRMAFDNSDARAAFFEARRGTSQPAKTLPGTAVDHVLATNVGIWGDRQALKRDAAEILTCELDTWARENGEEPLGLPSTALLRLPTSARLLEAAARVNGDEIDAFARSGFQVEAAAPMPPEVAAFQANPEDFLEGLYSELCPIADRYERIESGYKEDLVKIGVL